MSLVFADATTPRERKQDLMNKFSQTDSDGNELRLRENAMENWMKLLNLTQIDIELMRSLLNVYKTPKGGKIQNDFDINLLKDIFHQGNNDINIDNRDTDSNLKTLNPFIKLFNTKPYANIGHSIHVADINGDKEEDLLIGAPGKLFLSIKCSMILKQIRSVKVQIWVDVSYFFQDT